MIKPCSCPHPDQDALYGRGKRVYNKGKKVDRCTVCGKEVGTSSEAPPPKKAAKQ